MGRVVKRPGPPRRRGSDGISSVDPDATIKEARDALGVAEAEVARISRDRLAQLLGQGLQKRFHHFDDPDLLPADRVRLRASVLEANRKRLHRWSSRIGSVVDAFSRLLRRPRTIIAVIALSIGPFAALQVMAAHDGDRATVSRITRVTTKNQDGTSSTGALGPGYPLVVSGNGPWLQVREWIAGAGYKTYAVDARDVVVDRRSPWQAVMAFADAVRAAWTPPALPS